MELLLVEQEHYQQCYQQQRPQKQDSHQRLAQHSTQRTAPVAVPAMS